MKINKAMQNKIIFLDFSGVLYVKTKSCDEFGPLFHDEFVNNLKWIIEETGAKIVISSTWRCMGIKTIQKIWETRKLPGEVIDIIPSIINGNSNFNFLNRGAEIQLWLNTHTVEQYCIIDDNFDILESQMNNFVLTSDNIDHPDSIQYGYGLTRKCAEQVIEILNN